MSKIKATLFREVLERSGGKAIRTGESIDVTIEHEGDAKTLQSKHPDKSFGSWIVVERNEQ
jgi:hypothetical protein